MTGSAGIAMQSRPSWDEVWAHVAEAVSARSLCVRAQVGAVIVDTRHRIIATGHNGPPSGFDHEGLQCTFWCERGKTGAVDPLYDNCVSLHAEANALMMADRSTWQRGTIYVLGDICFGCAKLIANSGLSNVVVRRNGQSRDYRLPERSYEFLERCGLTVVVE